MYTPIPMEMCNDRPSILVFLHAQNIINLKTAALEVSIARVRVNQAYTVKQRNLSVQTLTAMVSRMKDFAFIMMTENSLAFDDQTSTFIIPAGAGFEVIFCPGGRSTNILATERQGLMQLQTQGHVKRDKADDFLLDLTSPPLEDIPLAVASQLTEDDQANYNNRFADIESSTTKIYGPHSTSSTSHTSVQMSTIGREHEINDTTAADQTTLSGTQRISMWSQRHRWNGSGTLIGIDLNQRSLIDLHEIPRVSPRPVSRVVSQASRHAHFVFQARVRSGFCLCLGMLVGAVGALVIA